MKIDKHNNMILEGGDDVYVCKHVVDAGAWGGCYFGTLGKIDNTWGKDPWPIYVIFDESPNPYSDSYDFAADELEYIPPNEEYIEFNKEELK